MTLLPLARGAESYARGNSKVPGRDGVRAVSRPELVHHQQWQSAFAGKRKDHRYYEVVEDTLGDDFKHHYLVVADRTGATRALQPCFVHDLDLTAGVRGSIAAFVATVRRAWPRFMRIRTLMVGCAAGEGHFDGTNARSHATIATLLAECLPGLARRSLARLIVFKEFPQSYREPLSCLRRYGYCRLPSLPAVRLDINYPSFEDYMRDALSRNARTHLRRNLRASEQAGIGLQVVHDISPVIDEAYPLYLRVYEKSQLRFEKLTREYFLELGRRMPDKVRFFLWRRDGRLVAFTTCLLEGDTLCAEYLGLDYSVALDLHLYFRVFRDEVSWAMAQGCRWYRSGPVQYDPKLHLRFRLEPLDLYVRHTSRIVNAMLGWLLPMMEPTRYDPVLPKFPNYAELWGGETARGQSPDLAGSGASPSIS